MLDEKLKLTGKLDIQIFDRSGLLKDHRTVNNLVVAGGLNHIVSRMTGTSAGVMSHMAVGTGTTVVGSSQTALVAETSRVSINSTTTGSGSVTYTATFPAGTATAALTEAGIFNALSAGTMLCRTVFATVNKGALDTMIITWTITLAAVV